MELIQFTHVAHQQRIIQAGPGGATYHHKAPDQAQSDAAAAKLIRRYFGPQPGQYGGTFGPLFRSADDITDDGLFGRRAVAFAAFHFDDISAYEKQAGVHVAPYVAGVDPSAQNWWQTLLADDLFNRLRAAAPVVMPTKAETVAAEGAAFNLWRTPTELYERAERRALEIT